MDKLDLNNSEFGGLTLTVKILIGIIVLILMAATAFGMCFAYNNWVKWTRKEENKNKLTALRAHLQQPNQVDPEVVEYLEKELLLSQSGLEAANRDKEALGLVKLILKAKPIECKTLEAILDEEEIMQATEKRIPDAAATSERSSHGGEELQKPKQARKTKRPESIDKEEMTVSAVSKDTNLDSDEKERYVN